MLNRTLTPAFRAIDKISLLQPQHQLLPNGVNLYVLDAADQDLVRIEWIFANSLYNEHHPLANMATSGMLLEGTTATPAAAIAEQVDFCGAFLQPEYTADHTALSLYTLNKHLPALLPLVKEVLTDAVFPQKELETFVRNNKQKLQVSLKKNDFVARREFNQALFNGSRYGYVPLPEDYDGLGRDVLEQVCRHDYVPANCTLMVAGRVTDTVLTEIIRLFGDEWTNDAGKPGVDIPVYTDTDPQLQVIERPAALQSAIRLGCRSLQRSHPDYPALQFVNTLLGGYFGSRLMMNIREEKGYTYGIGSGLASLQYGAFFTIATEVGVTATADTLTEIEKEMNRLHTEPVAEEELELVRNYMLGAFLGSLENVFSHVDRFKAAHFSGLDVDYYSYYTEVIRGMTADKVKETARRYLNYDAMVKVVVGKI